MECVIIKCAKTYLGGNNMKKIVNHPKGIRLDGVVECDGVGFLPERKAGPVLFQTSGYFATTGSNGAITSDILDPEEGNASKMDSKIRRYANWVMAAAIFAVFASLAMIVVSAGWTNATVWITVFTVITYVMWNIALLPRAWTILGGRIFQNKEMINFSKYLGAKNAVENAYYDLGRAPNIEEVKDYSIHSAESKYTRNSYIACLAYAICCIQFLNGPLYWLLAILAATILGILDCKNKLTFWQVLTVSTPDEEHYRVAIRAMEETEDLISEIHVSYHEASLIPDLEEFNEETCKLCPEYDFCRNVIQEQRRKMQKLTEEESNNNPARR